MSNSDAPLPTVSQPRLNEQRLWLGFFALVLVLGAFIYSPVRHFDFINMDDPMVLRDNPWMKLGLQSESVRWAFRANLTEPSEHAEYWSPLTLLSRLADAEIHGLNPGAFHVTNVLLHLVNTCLVFAAFRLLTGYPIRSAVVALLFLVHPLNVEPVCWLSARKDLLNATFVLATFLAYGWYARQPTLRRYLLVVLAYALCLMAKPMGVTVPFLLLILDAWPLRRWPSGPGAGKVWGRLLLEKLPLLVLAIVAAKLAIQSQQDWGALSSTNVLSMQLRLENAVFSYATYVRRIFWPDDLAIYYPHPGRSLTALQVGVALTVMTVLSLAAVVLRRRAPYFLAGWLWFGLVLGPVIGLMQIGSQGMADRYMYLAGLGLLVAIVWGVAEWTPRRWQIAAAVTALALATCGAAHQVLFWRNTETVFTHALAVTTKNPMAHYSLGSMQAATGPNRDAREHLRRAVWMSPSIHAAWENLGQVETKMGKYRQAIACYDNALKLQPNNERTLLLKGLLHRKVNDEASAEAAFQKMQQVAPGQPRSYLLLGKLYSETGRWPEAMQQWSAFLQRWPDQSEVRQLLQNAQQAHGTQ
jgi:tetratricopeptide (TPR) repeat protein